MIAQRENRLFSQPVFLYDKISTNLTWYRSELPNKLQNVLVILPSMVGIPFGTFLQHRDTGGE
ncbi:hypothetical protein, partial [Sphaerochaeta sp. S2]|uniref:hypothetical protein n=1 Tax=Sphaerochaeta sp. S2 TaxID=2798868 RepID=UPI001E34B7B1